jgi:multidrug efflux system membrane fusion protein
MRNRLLPTRAGLAALLLVIAAPCLSCSRVPSRSVPQEEVPVTAAAVAQRDVPDLIRAIGSVQARTTVEVRAQVGGVLEKVHFREGQDVRPGDLLFSLDARPYDAALAAARAALARDTAQLVTARQDVDRYTDLAKKEYVTQEEYVRIQTNAATLEAAVSADQAAIETATIDLGYCTIRSPIAGRTGQLMVHAGNLVKANADTPLVVMNEISPIHVAFSVPEQDLPEIQARLAAGPLEVRAIAPGSAAANAAAAASGTSAAQDIPAGPGPLTGSLTFVDNAVDRTTGTVRLKATFDNRDRALWPGQFVDVQLQISIRSGALLVPSQAIQTGQQGPFVYVVKADRTVESRPVATGAVVGADTVITSGLAAGETVVTDGQLRLVPGAKVQVAVDPPPGKQP